MNDKNIIEKFLKGHCSLFYDGDYKETLKDIKQNFLEGSCFDEKVVDGKIIFFDDYEEIQKDEHYQAGYLAGWYKERCPCPLGLPNLSDFQEQWWYDNLIDIFEKMPGFIDAIDREIRKV